MADIAAMTASELATAITHTRDELFAAATEHAQAKVWETQQQAACESLKAQHAAAERRVTEAKNDVIAAQNTANEIYQYLQQLEVERQARLLRDETADQQEK